MAAAPPRASVIVPVRDQWPVTQIGLQALVAHTRRPWELILVDDGSSAETAAALHNWAAHAPVPVTIPQHATPRGFPAAINTGLAAAAGDAVVLLNNDAVVTDGWLDQLIALTAAGPAIGLTGPMSNHVAPPQLVAEVPYRDLDAMHRFAAQWRAAHRGQWFTTAKLSGFCLLLTRAARDALGGLDERFGLGFFEDDDLCLRARQAGFALAVAHDLFVHHFGGRTFAALGQDPTALLARNQQRFQAKWGPAAPVGRPVTVRPWTGDTAPPAPAPAAPAQDRPPARRATVSLTMIVRDEAAHLPDCLASVQGLCDELVIVDTGSTDRTTAIARSFGARVFDFVWVDDFAAARNAALARATSDYAFWLDADDRIPPEQYDRFRTLFARLQPDDPAAYVVRCACDPGPNGDGGATVVDHVRLFPVREDVRWTYRVHEQILPALRQAGVPVRWTEAVVRHTGYADPAVRGRKLDRDRAILTAELAERPADPFVLFNLGAIAVEQQDWAGAVPFLERSLAGSASTDSITPKLYASLARAHQGLGDLATARTVCDRGLAVVPDEAELWFRLGVVHRHAGAADQAETCWRRVLELRPSARFRSVDAGIYGPLTRRNLAMLAAERGDPAEARRQWAAVANACPQDPEAAAALRELEPTGSEDAGP